MRIPNPICVFVANNHGLARCGIVAYFKNSAISCPSWSLGAASQQKMMGD